MRCRISRALLAEIRQQAAIVSPLETCGLLFGDDREIMAMQVAQNVATDPSKHFEIDPAALFAAIRAERSGGARLAGYWHSHPSGNPDPSATDAAMAEPDGRLWLIVGGEAITLWRSVRAGDRHGRFDAVPLIEV